MQKRQRLEDRLRHGSGLGNQQRAHQPPPGPFLGQVPGRDGKSIVTSGTLVFCPGNRGSPLARSLWSFAAWHEGNGLD